MTSQQFEMTRRVIANQLAVIMREINGLASPQERAYFEPFYKDAEKHLNDIRMQLIQEGKMRFNI